MTCNLRKRMINLKKLSLKLMLQFQLHLQLKRLRIRLPLLLKLALSFQLMQLKAQPSVVVEANFYPPLLRSVLKKLLEEVVLDGLRFGGALLFASALGLGIVSAPVIGVRFGSWFSGRWNWCNFRQTLWGICQKFYSKFIR